MRIRIMTFHTPKNYGAVLQGYSLMSYLEKYSGMFYNKKSNTMNHRIVCPAV